MRMKTFNGSLILDWEFDDVTWTNSYRLKFWYLDVNICSRRPSNSSTKSYEKFTANIVENCRHGHRYSLHTFLCRAVTKSWIRKIQPLLVWFHRGKDLGKWKQQHGNITACNNNVKKASSNWVAWEIFHRIFIWRSVNSGHWKSSVACSSCQVRKSQCCCSICQRFHVLRYKDWSECRDALSIFWFERTEPTARFLRLWIV